MVLRAREHESRPVAEKRGRDSFSAETPRKRLPTPFSGLRRQDVQRLADEEVVAMTRHQTGSLQAFEHRLTNRVAQPGDPRRVRGSQFVACAHGEQQLLKAVEAGIY